MGPSRMPTKQERRAQQIAVSAAADLNDELTIILTALREPAEQIPTGCSSRALVAEALGSAQRCAWLAHSLLSYNQRRGLRGVAMTAQTLMAEETT